MNQRKSDNRPTMQTDLPARHRVGKTWKRVFQISTWSAIVVLSVLLINILDDTFGYTAIETKVSLSELAPDSASLEEIDRAGLMSIIQEHLSANRVRTIEKEIPLLDRSLTDLRAIITAEVLKPQISATWGLLDSFFQRKSVFLEAAEKYPQASVQFTSWLNRNFILYPQSSQALFAGVRTAILGSLYIILITILFALPIGTGAAIYLQEYAQDSWLNRFIQTNINNLAGVPSIIYGMLGLAIFVRALSGITSGAFLGYANADPDNGRTILSAGLTIALLILPVIIINAQEAIKAVPNSLREASFGIGATRWQTVWSHVLPNAISGILTGTILAISRAFGETAPLIIVGASTYITFDPDGIFSKFTTLPIQIYQWTSRPQDEFRNIAAAGIIVLLIILLALNAVAIAMRNRFSRRMS